MSVSDFPAINASLNTVAAVLIASGWWFIRRDQKRAHIVCMVAALCVSTVFLGCYLYYHSQVGSVKFTSQGIIRPIYLTILFSHIVLAMAIVPLVAATVILALRRRFEWHRRLGRWTMPIWLYVSVTGVLVYLMLYKWFG